MQDIAQPMQEVAGLPTKRNSSAAKSIPLEAIIDYRSKGLTNEEIGKLLHCSTTNVTKRLNRVGFVPEHLKQFKENRADILAFYQRRILGAVTPSDLKRAGLRDKVIAAGVLYDKERLERGQSTANFSYRDATQSLEQIEDEIRALQGSQPIDEAENSQ